MAWLEVPNSHVVITAADHPDYFNTFTDLELKLLYKHTTGFDHTGYSRPALLQIISDLAMRLPVLECNLLELQAQVNAIPAGTDEIYRYVRGSTRPGTQNELFTVPAAKLPAQPETEATAQSRSAAPLVGALGPLAGATAADRGHGGTNPAPRPRAAPSSLPRGGTRETIWAEADKQWEAAGKPTEQSVILKLRKEIMNVLEAQGVKRTSSSNELGNWQKFRLSAQ
jgi:hypothetical protein